MRRLRDSRHMCAIAGGDRVALHHYVARSNAPALNLRLRVRRQMMIGVTGFWQ